MKESSYLSFKEVEAESKQEKRQWLTIKNAFLLFAVLLALKGACMMVRQNTGTVSWKENIMALVRVPRSQKSEHATFPVVDYPVCPGVHTWHTVSAIFGNWFGLISATYENVTFADKNCVIWKNFMSFNLTPEAPEIFGMKVSEENTFAMTYSVAVAQAGNNFEKLLFEPARKCVWVAAAAGPAYPDVRDLPYNGATCMWERVDGVGENYQVDYWDF